jgi:hypothetical protein
MEKNISDNKKNETNENTNTNTNTNINTNNNTKNTNTNKIKFNSIFKDEIKAFKNRKNNFSPGFMPKAKKLNIKTVEQNFNSTIHENEFENLTNSSYDAMNTFKEKTKHDINEDDKEEVKIREEVEEESKSNKKEEKTISIIQKDEKTNSSNKKDENTNSIIRKEEKTNSTIKEEKEEKSSSEKEKEDKKAPNNNVNNISKLFKGLNPSSEEKSNKYFNMKENKISNTNNERAIKAPIYQMTSTNEGGIIKALSRKNIMRKKKSKTANKYDFLI